MQRILVSLAVGSLWLLSAGSTRAVPPTRAGGEPFRSDGTHTFYPDWHGSDHIEAVRVAQTRPVTLYRRTRTGIYSVEGAEILLSGVPSPVERSLNVQADYLEVHDRAADGRKTVSKWDVSALTNPYLPPPAKPGEDRSSLNDQEDPDKFWGMRYYGDDYFSVHIDEHGEAVYDSNLRQTRLGSVFVDDANRVFFTPPTGRKLVYAKPPEDYWLHAVTHLAREGIIVFEWSQSNDESCHVGGIETATGRMVFQFPLGNLLETHNMLTWIDDHRLLRQFSARKFSGYNVINLKTRLISKEHTDSGYDPMIIRHGMVKVYHFPKNPDD